MPFPYADRPGDVFDCDLAAVREAHVNAVADAFVDDAGNAYPAGIGQRLKAGGYIHAIAVNVFTIDDDIAEINCRSATRCHAHPTELGF